MFLKRLDRIFTNDPVYGSRRLQVALLREGISIGRRRVRRLMRKLGLWALRPKRKPASGIPGTRSTHTFCAARRSTSRTKCGQLM
jgi:putative transposase